MKNKLITLLLLAASGAYGSEFGSDDSDGSDRSQMSGGSAGSSAFSDDSGDSGMSAEERSIDKTWALKKLLQSTPGHDLYQSPLLGLIVVGNGTIKKWYGEFNDVPEEGQEPQARNKRVFSSQTPLEKITRTLFNVLDGRVRCTIAGGTPFVALPSDVVAYLASVAKQQGVSGVIKVLEKGMSEKDRRNEVIQRNLSRKNKGDVPALEEEGAVVEHWWEKYKTYPQRGLSLRNFKNGLSAFLKNLKELEQDQGAEKAKQTLLTLLMSFVALKDEQDGQKDRDYAIENYFAKLGVAYIRDYYTPLERKSIQKRLGTSIKDFEDATFYLVSLAKNDFEFLISSATSAVFKETVKGAEKNVVHALCAEVTARSFINLVLYNPRTQQFDVNMLPEGAHLNQVVADFYFNPAHPRSNPKVPRYYSESADAWLQTLFDLQKKVPAILFENNELQAAPENMLLLFNTVFGTSAQTFEELGALLSKDGSQIVIAPLDSKEKEYGPLTEQRSVVVERDREPGEAPLTLSATLELCSYHAQLTLNMPNIMPLMGKRQYLSIEGLQKAYGVDLWSIVLNPAAINAVIDEETPFSQAIGRGYVPLVKLLLAHGADVHQLNEEGIDTLIYAYESGKEEMIKLLKSQGLTMQVTPETVSDWLYVCDTDSIFEEVIASGVRNCKNEEERKELYVSALIFALDKDWVDRAKKLIADGADNNFIKIADNGRWIQAPIFSATLPYYDKVTRELKNRPEMKLLVMDTMVPALILAGDDTERAEVYARALIGALDQNWIEVASALVQKGANTNFHRMVNGAFYGVVVSASQCNDEQFMQEIVDRLQPADDDEERALFYGQALEFVIVKRWYSIAQQLLEKGADVNFYREFQSLDPARRGFSALVLTASCVDDQQLMQEIVSRLKPAGDDEKRAQVYGQALYNVLNRKWDAQARELIEKGADVNYYGVSTNSASDWVYGTVLAGSSGNDQDIMKLIVDRLRPAGNNQRLVQLYGNALRNVLYKKWFVAAQGLVEKGAGLQEIGEVGISALVHQARVDKDAERLLQIMDAVEKSSADAQLYREAVRKPLPYLPSSALPEKVIRYGAAQEETIKALLQRVEQGVEKDVQELAARVRQMLEVVAARRAQFAAAASPVYEKEEE